MEKKPEDGQSPTNFMKFLNSSFGRFLLIGLITLLLLAPLSSVMALIRERKNRAEETRNEIRNEWGNDFRHKGLVLRIPVKSKKEKKYIFFFPEHEKTNFNVTTSTKKRGIYQFPVFRSANHTSARFTPDLTKPELDLSKVQIGLLCPAQTRISDIGKIEINEKGVEIEQEIMAEDTPDNLFYATAPFTIDPSTTQINVNLNYTVNGSGKIILSGFAKKSTFNMVSNWTNPSFSGNTLPNPDSFELGKGFKSDWTMMNMTQNPQTGSAQSKPYGSVPQASIDFPQTIDHYQLNERSVKYAILVILLTFTVFYLIELVGKQALHPIHYLLVGFSLILFYLILLSFSEQFGFARSYLTAGSGIVLLLGWYSYSVLKSGKFTATIVGAISVLYSFLYVMVNLETYALIVGSMGLFLVLAAIMSFTRRLKA